MANQFRASPLISMDGFNYLLEQSQNPRNSKTSLINLVDSIYTRFATKVEAEILLATQNSQVPLKQLKKDLQYRGIVSLMKYLGIEGQVLELCCGNGELSRVLASQALQVRGIDVNQELIDKNNQKNKYDNLGFYSADITSPIDLHEFLSATVAVGLHSCGNLTDMVLNIACTGLPANRLILAVPCCYGKINKTSKILPKSKKLSGEKEKIRYLLERVTSLEGYTGNNPHSRQEVLLELYRRLVDFDRLFFLEERGYSCCFTRISPRTIVQGNQEFNLSPANSAIVALRN